MCNGLCNGTSTARGRQKDGLRLEATIEAGKFAFPPADLMYAAYAGPWPYCMVES